MTKLLTTLNRFTFGFLALITNYCDWAASEASSERELLLLALLPSLALALLIWFLPTWLGMPLTVALLIPPLHALALLVRDFGQQSRQR